MHEYSIIPPEEKAKKHEFSALECIVAWLSFIGGYAFCRFFPVSDRPLGGFILILSAFIASSVVMICSCADAAEVLVIRDLIHRSDRADSSKANIAILFFVKNFIIYLLFNDNNRHILR